MYIKILSEVYDKIISCFKKAPIESGGMIGIKNGVICSFVMDDSGKRSCSEYHPNVKILNTIIAEWADKGISFFGLIHSHPNGQFHLSDADKQYFADIYKCANNVDCICCPIVVYNSGNVHIHTYVYDGEWKKAELIQQ